MKEISSYPGAAIFRSYSSLIIVLIAVTIFLIFIDGLEKDVERIAIDKTVTEINSMLMISMLEYIVAGKMKDLSSFENSNPFVMLEKKYRFPNYVGEVKDDKNISRESGWYFNTSNHEVFFRASYDDVKIVFRVKLYYDDVNNSGEYESRIDVARLIKLEKK
ncbi:MAG: hypothetical protein KAU21_10810, partial [Gammaproteobacteria bacterium]|nr:hypothetical protein [Gammaproteobacteria bacterium]